MNIDPERFLLMGIDPGTRACGWTVGNLDGVVLDTGTLVYKETDTALRSFKVAEALGAVASKWQVSAVYCEAPLIFLGAKPALVLGGLSALINYVIWKGSDEKLLVNYLETSAIRKLLSVPPTPRTKGKKLPPGSQKATALRWLRGLMDMMGLPYNTESKVPLGEEDRIESIGIFWAGCAELSRGLGDAEDT